MKTKKNFINDILRSIAISKRILLMVIFISIVPLSAIGLLSYGMSYKTIKQTASDYNLKLLNAMSQNIEDVVVEAQYYLNSILWDSSVRNTISEFENLNMGEQGKIIQNLRKVVVSQGHMLNYLDDLRIVTEDGLPVYAMRRLYTDEERIQEDLEMVKNSPEAECWFISNINDRPTIILARKILHIGTMETQGYIFLYINSDFLKKTYTGVKDNGTESLYLMDSEGEAMAFTGGTDATSIYYSDKENPFHSLKDMPPSYEGTDYPDKENFICYRTVKKLGWTVISTISRDELMKPLNRIRDVVFLLLIVLLLVSYLVSRVITRSISEPLDKMVTSLENASNKKFEVEIMDDNKDELAFLAQTYNNICSRMRELIHQIEKEQNEKRDTEIKMLQAQINPHFLFNTLDSLRFSAMMSNAMNVSDGLSALSHVLRNSILKKDAFIPLSQEIQNIRDYLTIQKIRYGENIHLNTEISAEAQKASVMKLLLQPIVENSVLHGMDSESDENMEIEVRAFEEDEMLHIIIQDDGKGFDPDKQIDVLTQKIKSSKMSGIGLENIKDRMKLEYGENQKFEIHSRPQCGTTVQIIIPYKVTEQKIL